MLSAGIELGVFEALAGGATTSDKVAADLGLSARGTRLLRNALAAPGLLGSDGVTYQLSEVSARHLVPGRPDYFGDLAKVLVSRWEWDGFATLAKSVRQGGPVMPEHADQPGFEVELSEVPGLPLSVMVARPLANGR